MIVPAAPLIVKFDVREPESKPVPLIAPFKVSVKLPILNRLPAVKVRLLASTVPSIVAFPPVVDIVRLPNEAAGTDWGAVALYATVLVVPRAPKVGFVVFVIFKVANEETSIVPVKANAAGIVKAFAIVPVPNTIFEPVPDTVHGADINDPVCVKLKICPEVMKSAGWLPVAPSVLLHQLATFVTSELVAL